MPTDPNESFESYVVEYEWMLYQIDDIGVHTHITFGYRSIETANILCEGIAGSLAYNLDCGYTAVCDYNNTVSLGIDMPRGILICRTLTPSVLVSLGSIAATQCRP